MSRPPKQRLGRISAERAIINAIRWIQRTGASWEAMPDRYPPRSTCKAHFLAWKLDGTWARVCRVLALPPRVPSALPTPRAREPRRSS
ncbi:transposase [Polyangium aurulentum]|nr:transposase [Polyangium aurulentum]